MPGDPEAIDQLTQNIKGLAPDQVEIELSSIMQYGSRNLLARTIEVSDIFASTEVLWAVEGAIDRVASPATRGSLGAMATEVVIGALRDGDFEANPFKAVTNLAASTDPFIVHIRDPRDKTYKLMDLSGEVARRIPGHEDFNEAVRLAALANSYLSRAKKSADQIEDPAERASILTRLGETSAKNLGHAWDMVNEPTLGNREHRRASRALHQSPNWLYGEAIRAAEDITKPEERIDQRTQIALSMARSISMMGAPESNVSAHMTMRTRQEISEVVELYETDKKLAKLPLAKKSYKLVHFGAQLAQIIDMEHLHSADLFDHVRQNLIDATVKVFSAARDYAQAIRKPLVGKGSGFNYPANLSYSASVAAGRFVTTEFEQAKELYEIGFDLGVVADTLRGRRSREASEVINAIGERAEQSEDFKTGFELFSLAHRLETGRLPENYSSHSLNVNARGALVYLSRSLSQEVAPEEIDRDFVEFIVRVATTDDHTSWDQHLRNMNRHVQDPELREKINERINILETRQEEARRPKTETARIAQQIVGRH